MDDDPYRWWFKTKMEFINIDSNIHIWVNCVFTDLLFLDTLNNARVSKINPGATSTSDTTLTNGG
jgi:hypothetical protein